jgi:hypothetical protein
MRLLRPKSAIWRKQGRRGEERGRESQKKKERAPQAATETEKARGKQRALAHQPFILHVRLLTLIRFSESISKFSGFKSCRKENTTRQAKETKQKNQPDALPSRNSAATPPLHALTLSPY